MNHTLKAAIALGMFTLAGGIVAAQSGNDLFQQALVKERTDGNPTEAIALYEKVIQQHGADRKLAAKALYQIGQAYEKLGQTEARKAYERIAREYADQKDVVADAGRRLAAMGGVSAAGRPTSSLVWKGRKVDLSGSVSADGRYLSFIDWSSGSVALHDIVTGEDRIIVEAKHADQGKWSVWAESSALSRDGKQVAYHWYDRTKNHCEVWLANLTGDPNPRRCYDGRDLTWLEPKDWSPDGKWVAVLLYSKKDTQLGIISVADGSLRVLKSAERSGSTGVFFSPDGKYVGYDFPQDETKKCDVWLSATDGSGHTAVVAHRSNDVMMGWSPDGKRLLFRSDRTGSIALWSLSISNGKAQGEPELIKPDMGEADPLGLTRTGAMFYGIRMGRARIIGSVEIGSFDLRTGAIVGARDVSDDPLEGNSWDPLESTCRHASLSIL